jgi:hypothetical protein
MHLQQFTFGTTLPHHTVNTRVEGIARSLGLRVNFACTILGEGLYEWHVATTDASDLWPLAAALRQLQNVE